MNIIRHFGEFFACGGCGGTVCAQTLMTKVLREAYLEILQLSDEDEFVCNEFDLVQILTVVLVHGIHVLNFHEAEEEC